MGVKRVALFNPVAGPQWHAARVRRALDLLVEGEQVTIEETRVGRVVEQAREWLAAGATELIACGGDGTACDVATALEGSLVPLRIVPCGTTNVLARDLGIPVDPVHAIEAVVHSDAVRVINTWTAGAHHVVLGAGIGWDARLLHRLPRRYKRMLGLGAMVPLGAWLALRYDFPALEVNGIDEQGNACRLHGSSVLVCNIGHWGGRNVAFPGVDPSDDVLDVVVCEPRHFLNLAAFWSLLMIPGGRPLTLPGVRHLRFTSLTVAMIGAGAADVHVNGEVAGMLRRGEAPLRMAPSGQVRVRVP